MGEIGIPRHEFLYDLQFWEVRRIIRGYRRRDLLKMHLLRLCAFTSFFGMRDNKDHLTPEQWLPIPLLDELDDRDEPAPTPLSEEEQEDMLDLLRDINAQKK